MAKFKPIFYTEHVDKNGGRFYMTTKLRRYEVEILGNLTVDYWVWNDKESGVNRCLGEGFKAPHRKIIQHFDLNDRLMEIYNAN